MKKHGTNVHKLTQLALLIALELLMAYTPLGMLPVGPFNASLLTIPVAIGAMLLGPATGALMGAIFGITSFLNAVEGKSAMGVALLSLSPAGYFLQAVGGRILCGLVCGWIYLGAKKLLPNHRKLCCGIGALSAPLLNTLFYMGFMMLLFFGTEFVQEKAAALGTANPLALVIAMVGVQGLGEAVTCCAIATAVTLPLQRYLESNP